MNRKSKYYQEAEYYPKLLHPEKYVGKRPITVRSSWEKVFIKRYLDINKSILEWSSESIVIPYIFRLDEDRHRYYPDFWAKILQSNGVIKEFIIEIKPFKETQPPKKPKRQTRSFKNRVVTYIKNQDKWKYAEEFCQALRGRGHNIEFKILTENELPV